MCQPLGQKNLFFHELLVGTYSLSQQDGRGTLCDKRDNNFVWNNLTPNLTTYYTQVIAPSRLSHTSVLRSSSFWRPVAQHANIYLLIGDVDDRQNFLFVYIHVKISPSLNPFTAKFSRKQISTKFPNFIQWNFKKQIALCINTESFHLNGHIIGFCAQTERLDSPYTAYKTPSNTLAVKGYLKVTAKFTFVIISVSVTIFYY